MQAKVNKSVTIHQGRIFKLVTENVTLPNGQESNLDIIRHPGAAIIVAVHENNFLLLRQYRHAVARFIWEVPAGTIDNNEPPLACAKRELIEETGYSADSWHKLGEIIHVPGYSDELIHVFLAKNLQKNRQKLDQDEVLEVHLMAIDKIWPMIYQGEINDGKSITALFLAKNWLESNLRTE